MRYIFTLIFTLLISIAFSQDKRDRIITTTPVLKFNLQWNNHSKIPTSEIHKWRYGPWREWKGVWTQRRFCVKHKEHQSRTYCKS